MEPLEQGVTVRQFGRFEVWRDAQPVPAAAWGRRKTQTLLKVLLTRRGQTFTADQLIDALFPDQAPERALVNLRGRVSELRRALEPDLDKNTDSQYVLTIEGGGYRFSEAAPCRIDSEAFAQALETARQAAREERWTHALDAYRAADALYRGDYLPEDAYEDWSLALRESLREQFVAALEGTAHCHALLGDDAQAAVACRRGLAVAPLRESLVRQLMLACYRLGEQSEALQAFEACTARLRERLEAEPARETVQLFEQIRDRTLPLARRAAPDRSTCSVAVLPFSDLGGAADHVYLADGLTEDIIAQLSRIRELKVISRTSVMRYKHDCPPLREIGRALGVVHVLEGSVRVDGQRVRITTQLVDARTDDPRWSQTYDRVLGDVFSLQSDVAGHIAETLKARLTDAERAHLTRPATENAAAYQRYLKGRFFFNLGTRAGFCKAIELFAEALAVDPGFALGHAATAAAYDALTFYNYVSPQEGYRRCRESALRALELDDALGEAHAALANVKLFCDWDWAGADQSVSRALDLNPGLASAHAQRARLWLYQGRVKEAHAALQRALALDPLSQISCRDLGYFLFLARRYDEAVEHLASAIEMYPQDRYLHFWQGLAHGERGAFDDALRALAAAEALGEADLHLSMNVAASRGAIWAKRGDAGDARRLLERLTRNDGRGEHAAGIARDRASVIAMLASALGDLDAAFAWLERAVADRDPWLCHLLVWPAPPALRADPRFARLLRRVGLDGAHMREF